MLHQQENNPLLLHIMDSPKTQNILIVVIHAAVVFFAKKKLQILEPFLVMLKEPTSLMVRFKILSEE